MIGISFFGEAIMLWNLEKEIDISFFIDKIINKFEIFWDTPTLLQLIGYNYL